MNITRDRQNVAYAMFSVSKRRSRLSILR